MKKTKITIIGCGRMGGALLYSLKENSNFEVNGVETSKERREELKLDGFNILETVKETGDSHIYIIAVKPQVIDIVLNELNEVIGNTASGKWIISIAAGITIGHIRHNLQKDNVKIVRVMPNTPLLVGKGMSGISGLEADAHISHEEISLINEIFKKRGEIAIVKEDFMDVITALSGSGPAYFFYLAEVMEKFAVDNGIDKDNARKLAYQTIIGSGELMKQSKKSFEELRKDVTSPGGTTEAAINYLKENKFDEIFNEALNRAKSRSEELSKEE